MPSCRHATSDDVEADRGGYHLIASAGADCLLREAASIN
jgi:hypothetical protein